MDESAGSVDGHPTQYTITDKRGKFKIVQKAPDEFYLYRKGLFFWQDLTPVDHDWDSTSVHPFKTFESAIEAAERHAFKHKTWVFWR